MDTRNLPVAELAAQVMARFEGLGYSKRRVADIRSVYRRLTEYCLEHGESAYSSEVRTSFLHDIYGVEPEEHIPENREFVQRALNMLTDYQLFGVVLRKTTKERVFPPPFAETGQKYLLALTERNLTERTVYNHKLTLIRFADYLYSHGICDTVDITPEHIRDYVKSVLCHFCNRRMSHELHVMREYLHLLWGNGKHPADLSKRVPQMPYGIREKHLPSAYTKDEIERMLAAVERDSPVGKRDYAVLLLVARLGIRASDLRALTFEQIDWENNNISFVQAKTGEPLVLPLIPEVGWALIDYIQHGRPITEAQEVFVRMRAPYEAQRGFNSIVVKYLRRADIPIEAHQHHGLHSLRHSLATRLLEESTPLHVIQEVLGHVNSNTTAAYLSVDVRQLRLCALEVPHESC